MKGGMGGKGNSTGGGRTMERSRRLDEDELKKHEDVIMVSPQRASTPSTLPPATNQGPAKGARVRGLG